MSELCRHTKFIFGESLCGISDTLLTAGTFSLIHSKTLGFPIPTDSMLSVLGVEATAICVHGALAEKG